MLDISPTLENWEYNPNEVTVRIIQGSDQKKKTQMRLDLGLLQMEFAGRPDGKRPHGYESYLEYYQEQMNLHMAQTNSSDGFFLDPDDCADLRREAEQYYYRYLSLYHVQEYDAVERDTARNLRVFDFIKQYAAEEDDRFALEQYRPYVIMMNTRAAAHRLLMQNNHDEACRSVEAAILRIRRFYKELGHPRMAEKCNEVVFLKQFLKEIREVGVLDPMQELRKMMHEAVSREDYENAARIRDEIKKLKHQGE